MAISERRPRRFTAEEYLTLERNTDVKSEWIDGEIFEMGGGSPEHNTIKTNVVGQLYSQLTGTSCRVYDSDMKVRIVPERPTPRGLFTYPDATVVCGDPLFHDVQRDVLVNPRVIFEVLSPSTEHYDRSEKRLRYQALPSLTDYVIVAQTEPQVEHWRRLSDGTWNVSTLSDLTSTLVLEHIGCKLLLGAIYERVHS